MATELAQCESTNKETVKTAQHERANLVSQLESLSNDNTCLTRYTHNEHCYTIIMHFTLLIVDGQEIWCVCRLKAGSQ